MRVIVRVKDSGTATMQQTMTAVYMNWSFQIQMGKKVTL